MLTKSNARQAPVCVVAGCGKPSVHRSLCASHNHRYQRYGDPLAPPRKAPNWTAGELATCEKFLDSVPDGARARPGAVVELTATLGRGPHAVSVMLTRLRKHRRSKP